MKKILLLIFLLSNLSIVAMEQSVDQSKKIYCLRNESSLVAVKSGEGYKPVYQLGDENVSSALHIVNAANIQNPFERCDGVKGERFYINRDNISDVTFVSVEYEGETITILDRFNVKDETIPQLSLNKRDLFPESERMLPTVMRESHDSVWITQLKTIQLKPADMQNHSDKLKTNNNQNRNIIIGLVTAGVVLVGVAITTIIAIKQHKKSST